MNAQGPGDAAGEAGGSDASGSSSWPDRGDRGDQADRRGRGDSADRPDRPIGVGQPTAGALLVATPLLTDPNFRRTVLYLVAHGDDGTAGLIINRRSETAVHNVLPGWTKAAARPQAVFAGGPVQTSGAMCLGVCRRGINPVEVPGAVRVAGSVVLIDLDSDPELTGGQLTGVRIFAGHAGWSPGQLAEEIAEGAWHVVPGRADDLLAGPRADLWFEVLRRQGFPLAWQAYLPRDVHTN